MTHLTKPRKQRMLLLLARQPDATLAEWGTRLNRPLSTIDLWLNRLGWSCKKTLHAAEQSRPEVVAQRKQWPQRLAGVVAARLVFVDESGAHTQMTRRCGRSPAGQRLACPVPRGHYQTTTLIGGRAATEAASPWLFDGPLNGELFLAWVQQGLVPCLQRDDVVILDNLARHEVAGCGMRSPLSRRNWNTCRLIRPTSTRSPDNCSTCGLVSQPAIREVGSAKLNSPVSVIRGRKRF